MISGSRLTDEEIIVIVNCEIADSVGYQDDELVRNRTEALDYYYGRPRGDDVEGNSKVQSPDLANMVEAVMSNIMPAFAGDTLVMFEADGQDDVRQALVESEVVNNQIMERNRGYVQISEAIKDCLLLRNGLLKCDVIETEESFSQEYSGIDDVTLALALMEQRENESKELSTAKENKDGSIDATITTVRISRELSVVSVDPTNFIVNTNHDSIFLGDARFQAERDYPTRTDLINEGFKKSVVELLPSYVTETQLDKIARRQSEDELDQAGSQIDESMEAVERYTSFLRVDRDQDGVAELHRLVSVGNTLLEDDLVDFSVYVSGSAFINPHQYDSLSLFDKLKNIQDIKTKTLRQWLDNLDANNHLTTVIVDGAVNIEDAKSTRPGKLIRARSPDAIREMPIADLGSSSRSLLEYADQIRSESGGASLDLQAAGLQLAGETAHGVERQMGSKEQLAAMMCRNIAETLIRSLFLLVHMTMRTKLPGGIDVRIGNEFVTVNPNEWVERTRVNVKAGLSIQERAAKKLVLEQIVAKQTELFQSGLDGTLVSMQNYHNALTDWMRASMVDSPERYFLDPMSKESKAAADSKTQQRQQAKQDQEKQQHMLFGVQNQLEQMQIKLNKYEFDNELRFKYWKESEANKLDEGKAIASGAVEIEKLDAQQGAKSET